jgi:hypothetical protein
MTTLDVPVGQALGLREIGPYAWFVLSYLAGTADADDGTVKTTYRELESALGISRKTIIAAIAKLVDENYITCDKALNGKTRTRFQVVSTGGARPPVECPAGGCRPPVGQLTENVTPQVDEGSGGARPPVECTGKGDFAQVWEGTGGARPPVESTIISYRDLDLTETEDPKCIVLTANERLVWDAWVACGVFPHRRITVKHRAAIRTALGDWRPDEIVRAIDNYGRVYHGTEFFFSYRWTVDAFLKRGLERFSDEASPLTNYLHNRERSKTATGTKYAHLKKGSAHAQVP